MKKVIWFVLLIVMVAGFMWWYVKEEKQPAALPAQTAPEAVVQIVASGYVPYTLVREMAGPYAQVQMLVPAGTEPHHFEPTPGAIIAIEKADLFVYVSPQIEPWTTDILNGLAGVTAVAAAAHSTGEDPHVWMTPYGALAMAKRIEKALVKIDPAHQAYYRQNLNRFEKEMQQLHQDFSAGLAHCQTRELVHVGHLAFGALAQAYHLHLQALSGSGHQGEHSVYKLTELVRFVRDHKLSAVFTEEMISPQLARTVAEETGAKILPLYTIEEVSKEDFEKAVSYSEYMRRNLHYLQEGLQCRPS